MSIHRLTAVVVLIMLGVLASGCATSYHSVSSTYSLTKDNGNGLVVFSTRLDDRCNASMRTSWIGVEGITAAGKKIQRMLLASNPMIKSDFSAPPGFFFVQEWPAGEYRLGRFSTVSIQGSGDSKDFNVFFTVEPGVVQYLGEFHIEMSTCHLFRLKINDEFERDARLFDERMKKVNSDSMVSKVFSPAKEKPQSED